MFKNQTGFTFFGLLVVLSILGMIALSVLKVFPVYMEHMSVAKSLESLENDPKIGRLTVGGIRSLLMKKFDMNAITSVKGGDVKIKRSMSEVQVSVAYEVRKDYFGNIDLVLSFHDEFSVAVQ